MAAGRFARRALGLGSVRAITPSELQELARDHDVLVVSVGIINYGPLDPRLPGEQRTASLRSLRDVLSDVPPERPIVAHCG